PSTWASARSAARCATWGSDPTDWESEMRVFAALLLFFPVPAWGSVEQIDTIVVIYAENRSFDHLYGLFPGAEGIAQATREQKTQLDQDGKPLASLPATYDAAQKGRLRDDLPTTGLPNGPFRIDAPPINR